VDQLLKPEDFALLESDANLIVEDWGPSSNLTFFWFNLGREASAEHPAGQWFRNVFFRRAVSHAVRPDSIVENVFRGKATVAHSLVPPSNLRWARQNESVSHDPAEARRLLREGGFRWRPSTDGEILLDAGGRSVKFELLTTSDDVLGRVAAVIQRDLREIGVQVVIRQEELRAAISRIMGRRDYDTALMNLDFPADPADYGDVFLSRGAMHFWSPAQPEPATSWERDIDALMAEQVRTLAPSERVDLFARVQEIVAREVPVVPLVSKDVLVARNRRLRNITPVNLFPYALWNVWAVYVE
jgi:peptide/nickel transport system substrate-binding protein